MGECISLVSKFAQILNKNGLASIQNIRSENVERGDKKAINPKMIVTLKKSADFDKLTEGLTLREWAERAEQTDWLTYLHIIKLF